MSAIIKLIKSNKKILGKVALCKLVEGQRRTQAGEREVLHPIEATRDVSATAIRRTNKFFGSDGGSVRTR